MFFSFHYKPDNWRASQVRNIGALECNSPASDNDWETITSGGDAAIERWISDQMYGRTCTVALIGENTAGRKWINHEIKKTWNDGKGLLGIHIHRLRNSLQQQSSQGANPFSNFNVDGRPLSSIVHAYDPPYSQSTDVYAYIRANVADWIEEAIQIRSQY